MEGSRSRIRIWASGRERTLKIESGMKMAGNERVLIGR